MMYWRRAVNRATLQTIVEAHVARHSSHYIRYIFSYFIFPSYWKLPCPECCMGSTILEYNTANIFYSTI